MDLDKLSRHSMAVPFTRLVSIRGVFLGFLCLVSPGWATGDDPAPKMGGLTADCAQQLAQAWADRETKLNVAFREVLEQLQLALIRGEPASKIDDLEKSLISMLNTPEGGAWIIFSTDDGYSLDGNVSGVYSPPPDEVHGAIPGAEWKNRFLRIENGSTGRTGLQSAACHPFRLPSLDDTRTEFGLRIAYISSSSVRCELTPLQVQKLAELFQEALDSNKAVRLFTRYDSRVGNTEPVTGVVLETSATGARVFVGVGEEKWIDYSWLFPTGVELVDIPTLPIPESERAATYDIMDQIQKAQGQWVVMWADPSNKLGAVKFGGPRTADDVLIQGWLSGIHLDPSGNHLVWIRNNTQRRGEGRSDNGRSVYVRNVQSLSQFDPAAHQAQIEALSSQLSDSSVGRFRAFLSQAKALSSDGSLLSPTIRVVPVEVDKLLVAELNLFANDSQVSGPNLPRWFRENISPGRVALIYVDLPELPNSRLEMVIARSETEHWTVQLNRVSIDPRGGVDEEGNHTWSPVLSGKCLPDTENLCRLSETDAQLIDSFYFIPEDLAATKARKLLVNSRQEVERRLQLRSSEEAVTANSQWRKLFPRYGHAENSERGLYRSFVGLGHSRYILGQGFTESAEPPNYELTDRTRRGLAAVDALTRDGLEYSVEDLVATLSRFNHVLIDTRSSPPRTLASMRRSTIEQVFPSELLQRAGYQYREETNTWDRNE